MPVAGDVGSRAGTAGLVFHSRICAVVTAGSCLAHLWLVAGNEHGTWLNLLMLAMVAVCLPCAVHIWRRGRAGSLRQVMAAALAMAGVHAVLLLGAGPGAGGPAHVHHAAAAAGAAAGAPAAAGAAASGAGALLAVVVLEMTTALLAATLLARLRTQPGGRFRCG